MSPASACGGASALNGAGWIMFSAARARSRSSITAMSRPPRCSEIDSRRRPSVVGIPEGRLAVVVECADALDAVGMNGRAPVGLHHDRDGLFDRLSLAHADRPLDRLDRSG